MDVTLEVFDANGAAVSGAVCAFAGGASVVTGPNGVAVLTCAAGGQSLTIDHPSFVREEAAFSDLQYGAWNNSLVSRVSVSSAAVGLRATLGRCAVTPTVALSEDKSRELALTHTDPGAALLFHPPISPTTWAYRFHWDQPLTIRIASARLLPQSPPDASRRGWDRFATTTDKVPIAERGRFFWLTYPRQPAANQFVVAIWSPTLPAPQPLATLDFITYFSPTTGGYTARYPYGLLPHGSDPADQQYLTLAAKYFLDEYCFAYQLAALGGSGVLVMPICRHGDWGPFASGEGLFRLLREVAVFLHRECRTSGLGAGQPGYDPNFRLAGGSLRSGSGIKDTYFGPVPQVGKVGVSFFSTGAAPAKEIMRRWALPQGYTSSEWGAPSSPGANPSTSWTKAWRELWDMDGFHPGTGGWPTYVNLLKSWYQTDRERGFHLCHSSGRVPPAAMSYPLLLGERPGPLWTVPATGGIGEAQELHGDRWSVVAFNDSYVENGNVSVMPPLTDAHHATTKVAFSHALSLTKIGVRRPVSVQRGP